MESYRKDLELEERAHIALKQNLYPRFRYDKSEYAYCNRIKNKTEQHKDKDVTVFMKNGKRISISEKSRFRDYGDVLIELIKNNKAFRISKTDSYGWGLNSEADYIVYYIMGSNRVVALDNTNGAFVKKIQEVIRRNNRALAKTLNKYKDKYEKVRDDIAFDSCNVTLTGSPNRKENGSEYNTYSICFPISFFRNENLLVYEGDIRGGVIDLSAHKSEKQQKSGLF